MSEVLLSALKGNLSDQYPEAFTPRRVSRQQTADEARNLLQGHTPALSLYDGDVSVRRSRVNDAFSPAL